MADLKKTNCCPQYLSFNVVQISFYIQHEQTIVCFSSELFQTFLLWDVKLHLERALILSYPYCHCVLILLSTKGLPNGSILGPGKKHGCGVWRFGCLSCRKSPKELWNTAALSKKCKSVFWNLKKALVKSVST